MTDHRYTISLPNHLKSNKKGHNIFFSNCWDVIHCKKPEEYWTWSNSKHRVGRDDVTTGKSSFGAR